MNVSDRRGQMYLINIVYSDGLYNGRESVPILGTDMNEVIKDAYNCYDGDYDEAERENELDCPMPKLTLEEFSKQMERGFDNGQDFIHIQCKDYHIQYEPKWFL